MRTVFAIGLALAVESLRTAPAVAITPTVAQCLANADRGQLDREKGNYRSAQRAFAECASEACPIVIRQDCVQWVDELRVSTPSVIFVVKDARGVDVGDVRVSMDGALLVDRVDGKPVSVDPGEHTFLFRTANATSETRLIVRAGEHDRPIVVRMAPSSASPSAEVSSKAPIEGGVPLVPAVLGGGALLAVGGAVALWISGRNRYQDFRSAPCAASRTCEGADVVRTQLVVGDILFVAGIATLGLAAWLWIGRSPKHAHTATTVPLSF